MCTYKHTHLFIYLFVSLIKWDCCSYLIIDYFLVIFSSELNNPIVLTILSKFYVLGSAKICHDSPISVGFFSQFT